MADLNKEQFEQLPDFLKDSYQADGEVYRHESEFKVASLKTSLDGLDGKLKETTGRLTEYEQKQSERQAEAERKALEKLKSEGKTEEIIADAERRLNETTKQFTARIEKMISSAKSGKKSEIVADLGVFATDKGRAAFKRLTANMIDYDPETGQEIYFNEDGSASSVKNRAEFMSEVIRKSETFEPLLKADIVTSGTGLLKGSNGDGGAPVTTMKREQFNQLNDKSKMAFVKSGGKIK